VRLLGRFGVNKNPRDIERALRRVVACARHEIPYYRHHLNTGPKAVRLDTLHKLPITTKADLVSQQDISRISRPQRIPSRPIIGTSGTTGQVLFIHMSRSEALFRSLSFYRSLRENSRLSWPLAIAELGVAPQLNTKQSSVLQKGHLVRLDRIPRLLPIEEQAARLIRSAPQLITGQATCLESVAQYLLLSGQRLQARLVVSRGEVLSSHARLLLEQAFDSKVVDYYNCEEVGNVAYECPSDSAKMHVNTDCCVVEIVNSEGAPLPLGIEGRIVVTNLFNLTMPFIRYDLGDYGTLTSPGGDLCDCGSRHPAMLPPAGRSDDFFRLANGSVLAPRTVEAHVVPPMLDLLTKQFPNIIGSPMYQIVQESEQLLRVRIASHFGFQEQLRLRIESSFRAAGHDVSVTIETVAAIPRTPSGKSRRIVSQLAHTDRTQISPEKPIL